MLMDVYDFGVRLKELRKNKNLTQAQVAKKLNLSRSLLSEYEANSRMPTVETLQSLAIIYGTTTDYILGFKNGVIINTTGLTNSQCNTLVSIIDSICDEFRKANKADD